ncbi:MAG: hypothetical protein MK132_22825 [Lentisphaerales bacterium]|nr:hypothetical protein [Lentisphaerales bacterium]
MTQRNFSFSRLQKLNFCKRAFYFHYQLNDDEFEHSLLHEIQSVNNSPNQHLASFQLKRAILRALFYQRNVGIHKLKQELAEKGLFTALELNDIDVIIAKVLSFKESSFFLNTEECFVKWLQLEEISSFKLEVTTILGNIDFAWYDQAGVNLVCLSSKSDQQQKLNFMLCYALRELKAKNNKVNIGLLDSSNWNCEWSQVNWHSYQEYVDQILSYSPPATWQEATATTELHRCNTCEYQSICENHSDILDI